MDKTELHKQLSKFAGCDVWTESVTQEDFIDMEEYLEREFDLHIGVSPGTYKSGVEVRSVALDMKDGVRSYHLWNPWDTEWSEYTPTTEERDLLQKIYDAYLLLA